MTLADLIRGGLKNDPVGAATATVATFATEGMKKTGTVARVAGVAVANLGSEKSEVPPLSPVDEVEDLREAFEERAGILEYDAGLPRPEAELEAARITGTLARNRGYAWASLRAALADYPQLLSQLPDKAGPVDTLPFGVATLAVLMCGRVVRQGPVHDGRKDREGVDD